MQTAWCLLPLLLSVLPDDLLQVEVISPGVGEDYEGMMEALADIQENGDDMMAGIWWQKEILGKLESSLVEAESRMEAVEERNNQLQTVRANLESEVSQLEQKKSDLLQKMSNEQNEVAKTRIELQPLETSLANARTELGRLSLDVTNKQKQLEEVQAKLDSSKSEVLSLSTTPTPVVLVLAISLVINFLVGLGLIKQLATAEERKEMALYGKDWVKKVLALSAKRKQTKISSKKETVETKDKQNIDDDQDWPWSSDFFDKFISSEFNLDWVPSHVKTSSAFN